MDLRDVGVHDASKRQSAVPLCLPNNYRWDSRTGKCIRTGENADKLYVVEEALGQLWKVKGPVCAVSIAGDSKSGKSYFLSEVFKQPEVFPVSCGSDMETIGIWLWIVPEKYMDASGQQLTVLLLDCGSFYDTMKDVKHPERWFALTILLSSMLIFNSSDLPRVSRFEYIANVSQIIRVKSSTETEAHSARSENESFQKVFPYFTWLLRDFMNRFPEDCRDAREFFIKKVFNRHSSAYEHGRNQLGEAILHFFPSFDAFSLCPPSVKPEVLLNLHNNSHLVNPGFLLAMEQVLFSLRCKLKANRSVVEGEVITGEGLASLVQVYVEMLNTPSGIVDMRLAWEKAMSMKFRQENESLMETIWELQHENHALKKQCACYNNISRVYQGQLQSITHYSTGATQLDRYEMGEAPRGICLVINNFNFLGKEERRGARLDKEAIEGLFNELHFIVEIRQNLGGPEILKVAQEMAAEDHSKYAAFVFCIMSHGDRKDFIYGVDNRRAGMEDLMNEFTATNCPTLANKPKLFFIQACRGQRSDPRMNRLPASTADNIAEDTIQIMHSPDADLVNGVSPREADFLLAFATVPGYKAWRSKQAGSWFIQVLVDVIRKYHSRHHLLDMLTEVNKRVADIANENPDVDLSFQVPSPAHTLRAQVFL